MSKEPEKFIEEDVGFYRAVESARQRALPLPVRRPTKEEVETDQAKQRRVVTS